jgi:hypothetical protein
MDPNNLNKVVKSGFTRWLLCLSLAGRWVAFGAWSLELGLDSLVLWLSGVLVFLCFGVLAFRRSSCLLLLGVALLGLYGVLAACLSLMAWVCIGYRRKTSRPLSSPSSQLPHRSRNSCQHQM